ncbi:MAG: proteophosphoglycan precursor [Magnetovibrio sp.]|nr:proteophosphoglycan precursor [Magnetovibrio sp.]|tara:strand:- start:4278 stop:4859 length:582 start_codon:yes stop_codon:yes gene_type:complete
MNKKNINISNFSGRARLNGPRPIGINTSPRQIIFTNIGLHIDKNCIWNHQGSPINNPKIVKLFASILQRDKAGSYWLITPAEIAPVDVEDVPFMATGFQVEGTHHNQVLKFVTNVDIFATVDQTHPLRIETNSKTGAITPYITLDQGIDAKINRATYYDLMMLTVEKRIGEENFFGVWSSGIFHKIYKVTDFS